MAKFQKQTSFYEDVVKRQNLSLEPPPGPIDEAHDHYMKVIYNTQMFKLAALGTALVKSIENDEFMIYGLVGRSLLEHVAVWRYFLVEKYAPLLVAGQELDLDKFRALLAISREFLFGTAFDWSTWLGSACTTEAMEAAYIEKNRSTGKVAIAPKDGKSSPTPVRVGKCVKSIGRALPKFGVYYDLFCDFVHPNMGSNFLGYGLSDLGAPEINRNTKISIGQKLIEETFPVLGGLTYGQINELTKSHFSMYFGERFPMLSLDLS